MKDAVDEKLAAFLQGVIMNALAVENSRVVVRQSFMTTIRNEVAGQRKNDRRRLISSERSELTDSKSALSR